MFLDHVNWLNGTICAALLLSFVGCGDQPSEFGQSQSTLQASVPCAFGDVPAGYVMGPCKGNNPPLLLCTCFLIDPPNPTASFDWRMPEETGVDADFNGVIDLSPPGNPPAAGSYVRNAWDVILDGCKSTPGATMSWDITLPSGVQHLPASGCWTKATNLPQGTYHVVMKARYPSVTRTVSGDITVKNYLIVSMGDSIASGEGNPDVPGAAWRSPPTWENSSCHRSANSGAARAALALERSDPHSSVTFLSEACSGARILSLPGAEPGTGGVLDPYKGQAHLPNNQTWVPQLEAIARALCPSGATVPDPVGHDWVNPVKNQCRPIDALLLQVGANDAGFGDAALACSLPQSIFNCAFKDPVARLVGAGLFGLPSWYDTLNKSIRQGLNVNSVFFGEYPDITHSETGQLCDSITMPDAILDAASNGGGISAEALFLGVTLVSAISGPVELRDGYISHDEIQWLHDFLVTPLNDIGMSSSLRNGWVHVGGIASAFATHGYCSSTPWVVKFEESHSRQTGMDGTFHPNGAGHQAIADRFVKALLTNLPGGNRKDVNGDGDTDIIWHNGQTGQIAEWLMNGTSFTDGPLLNWTTATSTGWSIKGTGDFNGDGLTDLLWYNAASGDIGAWYLDKTTNVVGTTLVSGPAFANTVGTGWEIRGTGDFNGDGKVDILWHHGETGSLAVWFMDGVKAISSALLDASTALSTGWEIKGTGDFDGDGQVDVLWHNRDSGAVGAWLLDGMHVKDYPSFSGPGYADVPDSTDWQLKGTGGRLASARHDGLERRVCQFRWQPGVRPGELGMGDRFALNA
jgi:lysophospholipase L1-like esterase